MRQSKLEQFEGLMTRPIPRRRIGIVKLQMIKEGTLFGELQRLQEPGLAVELMRPLFHKSDREMVVAMSLSTSMEPLAVEIVAVGGVDSCVLDVRNLFKHALLNNASFLMCFHNHPSGLSNPSREDEKLTERISRAGEILGISLVDHIIIGEDFYSFRQNGKLCCSPGEKAA